MSATVPQSVIDALNQAETDLQAARDADQAAATATAASIAANSNQTSAHQTANASSQAALDAVKKELGLT